VSARQQAYIKESDVNVPTPTAGRPRNYDLHPVMGFADQTVAYIAAALDELSERLFDLIADLPQDALDYIPEGTTNSIAMLVVHVAWAEASWVSRATGYPIPDDVEECLLPGKQGASGDLPVSSASTEELVACCRVVRDRVTRPALAAVEGIDAQLETAGQLTSLRQVLMHVIWHWIYHSGQVGLLRRLWGGTRYKWSFGPPVP
jgi:uncharacterized damage-inducible protein DinB